MPTGSSWATRSRLTAGPTRLSTTCSPIRRSEWSGSSSGESNIRRWIITNDWLEAVVALPDQLFYNTGISTYIWVLTNRKEPRRRGKVQLIDGRSFFEKKDPSLGNKRKELSPAQIDDLTSILGSFTDGETRDLTDEDPVTHQPRTRPRVVSKLFANEDFGCRKITVERPLRLSFEATPERIARIETELLFVKLATSKRKPGAAHNAEVAEGELRQDQIRDLLDALAVRTGGEPITDRDQFLARLRLVEESQQMRLTAAERKAVVSALGERDPSAEPCQSRDGFEPDPRLRDTETVPLNDDIDGYLQHEVLLHVPDAWVDHAKAKIGYEIPFNRHFYVYEPPRPLEAIEANLKTLETEIARLLADVTE
ncbi:MAG: N-6 DNA methylase [Acidimicrobiaceae bacterium]|nr:N-6 DNA methylase [Acidimicrobiaceae bacterium]